VTRVPASTLLVICLFAGVLHAEQATVLRNATLIDGTGNAPRQHVDVSFRDGLIEAVVPTSSTKRPDESGWTAPARPSFQDL
jgi:hypothetical protein